MPITIDTTSFPILVYTYQGELTLPDTEQYLKKTEEILQEGKPFVSIMRTEKVKRPERRVVQLQAQWFKHNAGQYTNTWLGTVFVFDSALPRFILTSVLLLGNLPIPYTTQSTFEEGLFWASGILTRKSIPLPEKLPSYP